MLLLRDSGEDRFVGRGLEFSSTSLLDLFVVADDDWSTTLISESELEVDGNLERSERDDRVALQHEVPRGGEEGRVGTGW